MPLLQTHIRMMNIQNIMYIQDWKPQPDERHCANSWMVTDGSLWMYSSSNYMKVLWSQNIIVAASTECQPVSAPIPVRRIHFYDSGDLLPLYWNSFIKTPLS